MPLAVVHDNTTRAISKATRGSVFKNVGNSILKKAKVLFSALVWATYHLVDPWTAVEQLKIYGAHGPVSVIKVHTSIIAYYYHTIGYAVQGSTRHKRSRKLSFPTITKNIINEWIIK